MTDKDTRPSVEDEEACSQAKPPKVPGPSASTTTNASKLQTREKRRVKKKASSKLSVGAVSDDVYPKFELTEQDEVYLQ